MASPNHGRSLYKELYPYRICLVGRGYGMNLYRRSLDLAQDILVNNMVGTMRVIFLFWKRARRRPIMVPRVGPSSNREEVRRRRK
jgi:hypothetical protein